MRRFALSTAIPAVLLLHTLGAAAQQAIPAGFSTLGGAVIATAHRDPEFGVSYPLAEWNTLLQRVASWGHGQFDGIITTRRIGLGLGHRFEDFLSGQGQRVSFTIGPAFLINLKADKTLGERAGLRGGAVAIFASITLTQPKKQ